MKKDQRKVMQIHYHAYANQTGYSISAQDYILAMLHVDPGIDIKFHPQNRHHLGISPNRRQLLKSLQNKPDQSDQIHIYHTTPYRYRRTKGSKKSIGICLFETINPPKQWVNEMNTMDAIIVASAFNEGVFKASGVERPIHVVPHCFDTTMFHRDVEPTGRYQLTTFLSIGTWKKRKNWEGLIKAFYDGFSAKDGVCLLIKTDKPRELQSMVQRIKRTCEWRSKDTAPVYSEENLACYFEEIPKIMKKGDIYVCASRGEGFCTVPTAKVMTANGYKTIIELKENDEVYTHTGQFKRIYKTFSSYYSGEMVRIKSAKCFDEQFLTPDHLVLCVPRSKCQRHKRTKYNRLDKTKICYQNAEWKPAKSLAVGDFLMIPKQKESQHISSINFQEHIDYKNINVQDGCFMYEHSNGCGSGIPIKITLDDDLLWLFGIYIAEGCSNHCGIYFSFHRKETHYQDKVQNILLKKFGLKSSIYYIDNKSTVKVYSVILSSLFSNLMGRTSHKKHMTFFMKLDRDQFIKLLHGILDGDGHYDGTQIELQTVAHTLMEQIYSMLLRFGISVDMKMSPRHHYRLKIYGAELNKIKWKNIECSTKKLSSRIHTDDEYTYVPVKTISQYNYSGLVYNIDVEDDHSYILQSVVHNCLPGMHAMALGVPLVTTRYGGVLEYALPGLCTYIQPAGYKTQAEMDGVPQFNNCIWPHLKIGEIRDRMRQARNAPASQVDAAYDFVHKTFNYDVIGKKLLEVIRS